MSVPNFSFLACLEVARLVRLARLARLAWLARLARRFGEDQKRFQLHKLH